jgi:hypothetical protein
MSVDLAAIRSTLTGMRERDGVIAIPGYWPTERYAQARAEIDRIVAQYPDTVQNHSGGADKRMYGVESVSPLLMTFHADRFPRQFGELLSGPGIYDFAALAHASRQPKPMALR